MMEAPTVNLKPWPPSRGPIVAVWPSLEALRRARSLSISELAKWAGVDRNTAQRALRGGRLSARTRRALAAALRVDPDSVQWEPRTPRQEAN